MQLSIYRKKAALSNDAAHWTDIVALDRFRPQWSDPIAGLDTPRACEPAAKRSLSLFFSDARSSFV